MLSQCECSNSKSWDKVIFVLVKIMLIKFGWSRGKLSLIMAYWLSNFKLGNCNQMAPGEIEIPSNYSNWRGSQSPTPTWCTGVGLQSLDHNHSPHLSACVSMCSRIEGHWWAMKRAVGVIIAVQILVSEKKGFSLRSIHGVWHCPLCAQQKNVSQNSG